MTFKFNPQHALGVPQWKHVEKYTTKYVTTCVPENALNWSGQLLEIFILKSKPWKRILWLDMVISLIFG